MWVNVCGNYEVSAEGHIRNRNTGRILKEFVGKDGYLRVQFAGKTRTVHRVVATAYVPADVGKDFVNHKDGNKQNNHVDNLEWVTRRENMQHAYDHGLKIAVAGVKNGRTRLSMDDVEYIRNNYKPGDKEFGAIPLAQKFGVAHQTISAVAHRQTWKGDAG